MFQESVPLPKQDAVFSTVKSSCKRCREQAGLTVNDDAIATFLTNLTNEEERWSKLSAGHGTKLPLNFDNFLQEVNLIGILELLNFCSGYRMELKRLTGRGAFDTIRALVLSFHISQTDLSAWGLSALTTHDIAGLAQLPVSEEVPHPTIQGLNIGQRTQLAKMAEEIARVLRETGELLVKGGYQNLGAFVIECAKRAMVDAIPGFRDMCVVNGEPVYILKKVQLLAFGLSCRFSSVKPDLFDFFDISELPIFSDNVIPTVLNYLSIIPLSTTAKITDQQKHNIEELQEDLRTGRATTRERSYVFRAAAVDACEIIVQRGRGLSLAKPFIRNMTAVQLDAYLWQMAKQGQRREVIRFSDPHTIYF